MHKYLSKQQKLKQVHVAYSNHATIAMKDQKTVLL